MGAPANLPSIRDANASLGAITSQEMQKDAKMAKKKTLKRGIVHASVAVSSLGVTWKRL